jgi:hypothetical protein
MGDVGRGGEALRQARQRPLAWVSARYLRSPGGPTNERFLTLSMLPHPVRCPRAIRSEYPAKSLAGRSIAASQEWIRLSRFVSRPPFGAPRLVRFCGCGKRRTDLSAFCTRAAGPGSRLPAQALARHTYPQVKGGSFQTNDMHAPLGCTNRQSVPHGRPFGMVEPGTCDAWIPRPHSFRLHDDPRVAGRHSRKVRYTLGTLPPLRPALRRGPWAASSPLGSPRQLFPKMVARWLHTPHFAARRKKKQASGFSR